MVRILVIVLSRYGMESILENPSPIPFRENALAPTLGFESTLTPTATAGRFNPNPVALPQANASLRWNRHLGAVILNNNISSWHPITSAAQAIRATHAPICK